MAQFLRNLTCIAFSVTLFLPLLRAQDRKPVQLDVRFTVFSGATLNGLGYVVHQPHGPDIITPVTFYPMSRSPIYDYRGESPLEFVNISTRQTVASVVLPREIRTPLLVFITKAGVNGATAYDVIVVDDSLAAHGPHGVAILNLSGLVLTGTINKQNVQLTAGWNQPIEVRGSTKVQFRTEFKGRSYQSFADVIHVKEGERALLVFLPPFYKGALDVQCRVLLDVVPAQKSARER